MSIDFIVIAQAAKNKAKIIKAYIFDVPSPCIY